MGYRLPKTRLRNQDVPDPTLVRKTIAGVAEELSGNTNEHNIVSGTFGTDRRTNGMLYDFHFASVDADPKIHTNASHLPDATDADAFFVPDSGEWTTVGSMSVSYTTAEHVAWCLGWLFYGIVGTSFSLASPPQNKPRVQFALRVNGVVIEETTTGTVKPDDGAPRTVRPITPVTGLPIHEQRSLDYQTIRGTGALSWHVRPVRVQCQVAVPQGTTTVEIVVRRIYPDQQYVSGTPDPVYVYNRKLLVAEMKLGETGSATGQLVSPTYPSDGTLLNAANTDGTMLTPVKTAINDLGADAVRRGGLRKEHLPGGSFVRFFASAFSLSPFHTARVYPGWGSDGTVGLAQWDIVNDGAGGLLSAVVNWNFATNPAFVIVLANVAFVAAEGSGNTPERYGVFSIATHYQNGTYSMVQADQCWCNNPNIWTDDTATILSNDCLTDIPLLAYFDYRTAPPANGAVESFRVNVAADNTTQVDWHRSSIFVLGFYP